jgi:dCMP deaminase
MSNSIQAILYIPVLHQGYLDFLSRNQVQRLYLLGSSVLQQFRQLQKDIRALKPQQMAAALPAVMPDVEVRVLEVEDLPALNHPDQTLVTAHDEVMHTLVEQHLAQAQVMYDTVFLRWDRQKSLSEQQVEATREVTENVFDQEVMAKALAEAEKSSDWWRRVGAAIVKDGQVLEIAFNQHVPDQQQPYYDGDPRAEFHRGEHIDKSTAIHAEAYAIAQAAKKGASLAGADLYVTTFPCPTCAKLIAFSGIKKLYFREGYAMVDGEVILKDQGVEIIRVLAQ